jgi:hypothetical protein
MAKSMMLVPMERIVRSILTIRGQKVLLANELAELYDIPTKQLNQQVRRNRDRFPEDFMFQLTAEESAALRSQIATLDVGRGKYSKYAPYVFTEQGVAMLSSVLKSKRAVQVNIAIMRAFVELREMLSSHKDLARKLEAMEKNYDEQFRVVFDAIRELMTPPKSPPKRKIGFIVN